MKLIPLFLKNANSPRTLGKKLLHEIQQGNNWDSVNNTYSGPVNVIKRLIEAGADLTVRDEDGDTAFLRAVDKRRMDIVDILISLNRPALLQARNIKPAGKENKWPGDYSALFLTLNENMALFKKLADAGVDVNAINDRGDTVLVHALKHNTPEIINHILGNYTVDLNKQNNNGETALHHALEQGYYDIAKTMLQKGADIFIQDYKGHDALFWAIKANDKDVFDLIRQAGADINRRDKDGRTPLIFAAGLFSPAFNALVNDPQVDIDAVDMKGYDAEAHAEDHQSTMTPAIQKQKLARYCNDGMKTATTVTVAKLRLKSIRP